MLVNGIVNNAMFHSNSHIDQTLLQIIHILHLCLVQLLLNYVPDFVVNCVEVRAVRRPQIRKFIDVTTISDCCTFGVEAANDARNCADTAGRQKSRPEASIKNDAAVSQNI